MGSTVFAEKCKTENKKISGMIAFDTIGYYSDKENSQKYPPPLDRIYPTKGNFIAFVGGINSVFFLRDSIAKFRKFSALPSEGAAVPYFVPGSDWSDHWSFARLGYNAIMITNTAMNRTPYYHTAGDTYEKLDYNRMAMLVDGVEGMLKELANE
jgi:Zn-dependent M28 family amino/carboxypeptidase